MSINKKYKVICFFLICLSFSTSLFSQSTLPWYIPRDSSGINASYSGTSGGTYSSVSSSVTPGSTRSGSFAYSHTPNSTTTKYWYNTFIGIFPQLTTGNAHMIYWAKVGSYNGATSASTTPTLRYVTNGVTGGGSSSTTTSTATTLNTSTWTRCVGYTSVTNNTRVYFAAPFTTSVGNGAAVVFYDDFVLYYDAGTTTDITPPSTGPSAITNTSGVLSWFNGTDAGTGVQGSIVLVSSNANATAPTLLDQGYYPAGATVGTDWTVATNTNTTSWTITGTPLVVAVINYDKAYNYSTAGVYAVSSISTTVSAPLTFCAGATLNVGYTANGSFAAGNVFTAQLSNSSGSFAAPVNIGTLTSTSSPGTISCTIPVGATQGSGYRIRVVSSNPSVNGTDNGANILINTSTSIAAVINPSICSSATAQTTSINYTALGSPNSYTITGWSGGGFSNASGTINPVGSPILLNVPAGLAPGSYTATLTLTGTCGSANTTVTIQVSATPTFTSVSQSGTACSGQSATISLSGLIANSVNTVFYRINGGATQTANSVTANGSGGATFSFICSSANNGQQLIIDSIRSACTLQLTSNNSITLNISTTPPNATGVVNGSICSAGTVTISVASQAGYTTNWYSASSGGTLLLSGNNSYTTPALPLNTTNTYYAETVAVPSNGCVSLIRVPVTASTSQVSLTLTNATIYRQVPSAPFITNLPYSSTVGAPDRYDLTWGGAYGFPAVNNSVLPASRISLTITNAVPGTYYGSIVVRNSTTGCTSTTIPFVLIVVDQVQGDYGSVVTGLWSAFSTTWKLYDTATGSFSNAASIVPSATNNVWINSGYTTTLDGNGFCKNLYVAGNLTADVTTKSPRYLEVSGNVVQMLTGGFIGNPVYPTGDLSSAISIISKSLNLRITGNDGSVFLSRLYINLANSKLIIDRDITLTYHGTSNQGGHTVACYTAADNDTLIVNAGKTMTFAPWASLGTTETTGTPHPNRSFTINVYGTINLQNTPAPNSGTNQTNNEFNYRNSFIYGGVIGAGKVFTLNIFNGGIVNTAEIYPNGNDGVVPSPGCWIYNCAVGIGNLSNINVETGGVLNVYKVADFRNPAQLVTGGGSFNLTSTGKIRLGSPDGIMAAGAVGQIQTSTRNFSTTGVYCYEGVAAQNTGTALPATVSGLIINNTNNVTLTNNLIATDSVNLTIGKLILGDKNVTTNTIRNGSNSNYVVTNGMGYLKLLNVSSVEKFFPVGTSVTSYNPAWITNSGTSDNVSVKVDPYALGSVVAWPSGVPRIFRSIRTGLWNSPSTWETESYRVGKSVNRSWTLGEDVAGSSNLSVRFQWNLSDENPGFNRALSSVVRYNGSVIDYPVAPIPFSAAAGTNPYTQSGSSINSVVQQFGVVSDTSTSVLFGTTTNAYPNTVTSNVIINQGNAVTGHSGSNAVCGNLQIDGTLSLSSTNGDNLQVGGNWVRSATGVFNANDRTVILNGSSNTSITANNGERFSRLYLQKNGLANVVSLVDSIAIAKELKVETGTLNLAAKNITLLSDSSYTASLSTLNANGAIQYSGAGRFVVERYINTGVGGNKHPKSWQLLCAPASGQTIKESWMENGSANSNPVPGFGTQIVGPGGVANGFDTATVAPSMKVYSPMDSSYVGVANTGLPINNNQGYMFFVRGDRSVVAYNSAPKPTILRSKGTILTGNVSGPVIPLNKFQSIANPYPAAVNFSTVTKSGLSPFIYVYDPTLASYYGLGAFQTIEMSNGNATPGGTNLYSINGDYRTIQSGQAFFVRSSAAAGSVTFKETDKVSDSRLMTRDGQQAISGGGQSGNIITQLYSNAAGKEILIDGNKVIFEKGFSDNVDVNDAVKLANPKDNFGLIRNGAQLAIETRSGNNKRDTLFYDFKPSQKGNYSISISGSDFSGKFVYLIDNFTKQQTRVDVSGSTTYNFEVNENQASAANNRFYLMILEKSIEEIKHLQIDENAILVYPNPIQDKIIRIVLPGNCKAGNSYEIRNNAGQLMSTGSFPSNQTNGVHSLMLPDNLASGTYFISVFGNEGTVASAKFIYK